MTMPIDVDHQEVLEVYPTTDETGQPETLGSRWSWRLVSYPSHAVLAFCIGSHDTADQAEDGARELYADVDLVLVLEE